MAVEDVARAIKLAGYVAQHPAETVWMHVSILGVARETDVTRSSATGSLFSGRCVRLLVTEKLAYRPQRPDVVAEDLEDRQHRDRQQHPWDHPKPTPEYERHKHGDGVQGQS